MRSYTACASGVWADHLARASEYRSGVHWVSWSGEDPHREYLLRIDEWFREMEASLTTTDQPFGRWKSELSRLLPWGRDAGGVIQVAIASP
jgi:hypothetical protein